MFNLEQSIGAWRRQMTAGGIGSCEVLDELESHLRDEIERQVQSGVAEETAYEAAVACLGDATSLKAEFAKVNPPKEGRRRLLWAFYFVSVALLVLTNSWTLLEWELSLLERLVGFAVVGLVGLYAAGLPFVLKSLSVAGCGRLLKTIKVTSPFLWLWPAWALLEAEHIAPLEIGQVPSLVLWCLGGAIVWSMSALIICRRPGSGGGFDPQHVFVPPPGPPVPPTLPRREGFPPSLSRLNLVEPGVRESLEAACAEATRLGHDFIGTEHFLLGLLKLARGRFTAVLQRLGLHREAVRLEVERLISPVPSHPAPARVQLTPRACKAIQIAAREAKALKHPGLGAEHMLLGLLLEGSGVAAQALKNLGIQSENAREAILSELRARSTC